LRREEDHGHVLESVLLKRLLLQKSDAPAIHLFRSVKVSLGVSLIDFGLLALLVEFCRMNYLMAASAGFAVGVSLNYFLSIRWVFATRNISRRHLEYLIFAGIGVAGLLLNGVIMVLLVEGGKLNYLAARMISGSAVFLASFFFRRTFLFRPGINDRGLPVIREQTENGT